jgi:hypothetical protein
LVPEIHTASQSCHGVRSCVVLSWNLCTSLPKFSVHFFHLACVCKSQRVLWTPSLLGSTDRPRPVVLRFGLVMARASTDQKGFITGLRHHLYGCPCLRSCTNFPFTDQPTNQPTNPPTNQPLVRSALVKRKAHQTKTNQSSTLDFSLH